MVVYAIVAIDIDISTRSSMVEPPSLKRRAVGSSPAGCSDGNAECKVQDTERKKDGYGTAKKTVREIATRRQLNWNQSSSPLRSRLGVRVPPGARGDANRPGTDSSMVRAAGF